MQLAFSLAEKAAGKTSPNPAVGAVLVKHGQVIAKGYTHPAGEQHAEVDALLKAGDAAQGCTMYVTLEPCAHYGRTPPCTKAIVEAGVAEVHYAIGDPNPKVNGRGRKYLEDHGVKVFADASVAQGYAQNRAFFHYVTTGQPYVFAKYAMTLDGKIATVTGESKWITGGAAREHGHRLRNQSDAILVGVETVIADDPQLTTRLSDAHEAVKHPLRIVLDSTLRIPLTARVIDPALPGKTLIITTNQSLVQKRQQLKRENVDVLVLGANAAGQIDLKLLLDALGQRDITSLMVEGGAQVLGSFVAAGYVQEIWTFIAPKLVGGVAAKTPVGGNGIAQLQQALQFEIKETKQFGADLWVRSERKV